MKRSKNPRGPVYGAAGAAAAVAVCLGAMVLAPAVSSPAARPVAARVLDQPSDVPVTGQPTDPVPVIQPTTAPPTMVPSTVAPATAAPAAAGPGQGNGQPQWSQGEHPGDRPGENSSLASLTTNPDCTLWVPQNPLTAGGLATPYRLGSAGQQCNEASEGTAAFVQATILDPRTGALAVYDPVVTDNGQKVTPPPVPRLPRDAIITIWTGFNANVLKLVGPGARQFVNFAQQSYANSPGFFAALYRSVRADRTMVPALGTSPSDSMTCPSVRDFSVVDQDQSDNVPVAYGAPFGTSNGSDDDLLTLIDAALGCAPWQAPLLDPGVTRSGAAMTTAGPLEEVQASFMLTTQALVPGLDPFVTLNGKPDLALQNLYRAQVGQPPAGNDQDTTAYCQNLAAIGEPRLKADVTAEQGAMAPDFAMIGSNLSLVLAARFAATWANLTCPALTGMPSPIQVTVSNGIAVAATYTP